ncbi:BON domain-containing protein [Aestuariibacter sp. AA17]|uniref:BON domain-containing protein n=1 Tax=Fluctibacter corallii TaxID=2984329 RepID=A0ABT3A617_9ALTE|nr:BON domain-containing protein [Aestuariibacter sp. AA17]MCV2883801.1 BON domain-containing protein [Aestuariibacter sp. AA17]
MKKSSQITMIAISLFFSGHAFAADKDRWEKEAMDAWLDGKAETVILFNTNLNSFDINTDVQNGTVILTGKVDSDYDKRLATELIRELEGVKEVDNKLTVLHDNDAWVKDYVKKRREEVANYAENKKEKWEKKFDKTVDDWEEKDFVDEFVDAKISSVIGTKMLFNTELDSDDIDIEVDRGDVFLMGHVSKKSDIQLAEKIAKGTEDVRKVHNKLTLRQGE